MIVRWIQSYSVQQSEKLDGTQRCYDWHVLNLYPHRLHTIVQIQNLYIAMSVVTLQSLQVHM